MPNLSEILQKECTNTHTVYFYREGVFYKAYDRSAYLFVKFVKPFQIKKRMVKSVKQEVVSIGFPTNSLVNYFSSDKIREKGNIAEVDLEKNINVDEFEWWKSQIPILSEESSAKDQPTASRQSNDVLYNKSSDIEAIMKIKMFPIEGKTPLECMLFLSELKKAL